MSPLRIFCLLAVLVASGGCQEAASRPVVQARDGGVVVSSQEELSAALKQAAPGDVILWKDGTYADISVKVSGEGAADAPIVLRAQTSGRVVFKGHSSITLSGSFLVAEGFLFSDLDTSVKGSILTCAKGSDHCRFSACKIDGRGSKVSDVDTKWVSLYGHDNEVSGCSFVEKRNMGCLLVVWMEDGIIPRHTIRNNYFTRPYTHYDDAGKARNSQESIRIGTSDFSLKEAACLVEGNHFYRCHGERAEIISNKSCGNLYRGNLFEEGEGTLTLRHGNRCRVTGNYFLSGGKAEVGGVRVIGQDHEVDGNVFLNLTGTGYKSALCLVRGEKDGALNGYAPVTGARLHDNVFLNCRYGFVSNYSGRDTQDTAPADVTFSGNVLVSEKSYMIPVQLIDGAADGIVFEKNVIFGGSLKNVSLEQTKDRPVLPDYTETLAAIRSNAGVTW